MPARLRPIRSCVLAALALDGRDIEDLVAFMRSLTSPQTTLAMPHLPVE